MVAIEKGARMAWSWSVGGGGELNGVELTAAEG